MKTAKKPISVSNANTVTKVFCFSLPHAQKETTTKKYFPPSESVPCSPGKTAWVCVKFKFLMTALGKRKENNEIKPLPPDLGWDVTACLFSPAPVFSQLSNVLCSCGSMIQRKEKKKRREGGRKSSSFSLPACSTSGCRHLMCLLGPKRDWEQRDVFFKR